MIQNMRTRLIFLILLFGFVSTSGAQSTHSWDRWNWLLGKWQGKGSGQPGKGSGTFTFTLDLDGRIIVRKNHTEYPASGNKAAVVHDDLMIIYPDPVEHKDRAVYFDNEGHTIFYSVSCSDTSIVLTSDKIPDNPVYRLVYTLIDNETVNIGFEMSRDGSSFTPYLEGKSRRVTF